MQSYRPVPHSGFGIFSVVIPVFYLLIVYGAMLVFIKYQESFDQQILNQSTHIMSIISGIGNILIGIAVGMAFADIKNPASRKQYNFAGLVLNSFVLLIVFVPSLNNLIVQSLLAAIN